MRMIPVESSNVSEIGYESGRLVVRFKSGTAYEYLAVPVDVHASLMASASKGQYLARQVVHSGLYDYRKLRPEELESLTHNNREHVSGTAGVSASTLLAGQEVGADHGQTRSGS